MNYVVVEADEEMDKKLSEEKRERKNTNIEHKKMFAKMFMKKIGVSDVQCSDFDIHESRGYYIIQFDISAEIKFYLDIRFIVVPRFPDRNCSVALHSKGIGYYNDFGNTNISGDQNIINDKPKSKLIFDYFMNDGHNKIKPIIRDLYPFIFATDYMQNLPKAYTFLLCCPGTIPKGVDKIIARKILFFPN